MKDVKNFVIGVLFVLILILMAGLSMQSKEIATKTERLRCIEKMLRPDAYVDPYIVLDIVSGMSDDEDGD